MGDSLRYKMRKFYNFFYRKLAYLMFDGEHYLRFFHPAQQNLTQQLSLYRVCSVFLYSEIKKLVL